MKITIGARTTHVLADNSTAEMRAVIVKDRAGTDSGGKD
ncbi:hypothetical protein JOD48_002011 [Oerskovia paurometabola]|nr:hypothetical protein [Oerskovia paurometabola]